VRLNTHETRRWIEEYGANRSESAFRALVETYINLVYSTALRLANRDSQLAEDITQAVFIDLARMAAKLPKDVLLGGWLHRHTRFVASKAIRHERRRQCREREAVEMSAIEHQNRSLEEIKPVLDEAIGRLSADDQAAILLRFFEQQDFRAIGDALGSSENAARMRVNRALDKLHAQLVRQGFSMPVLAFGTALSAQAVSAAPPGLAFSVASAALVTSGAGAATLTVANFITMTKVKATILGALVVAGAGTPLILQHQANVRLRTENATLRAHAMEADNLREEIRQLGASKADTEELNRLRAASNELMRLRSQAGAMRPSAAAGTQRDQNTRTAKTDTAAARSSESPTTPMIPAESWRNVGTTSPSNALQTLFWASRNQDTNAFLETLVWDGEAKAGLEQLFAAAPESVREKFRSVDGLIYEMAMGGRDTPMKGFGIVSLSAEGDTASMVEEHQYEDGRVRQNEITLVRGADGWRVLLDERRLEKLGSYLKDLASRGN
jgi:RNA polymerase sigma factor (sigma-70 family)